MNVKPMGRCAQFTVRAAPDLPGADLVAAAVGAAASAGYHRVVIRLEGVANLRSLRGMGDPGADHLLHDRAPTMQRLALAAREPLRDAGPAAQRYAVKTMASKDEPRGFTFVTGLVVAECGSYDDPDRTVRILGLEVPVTVFVGGRVHPAQKAHHAWLAAAPRACDELAAATSGSRRGTAQSTVPRAAGGEEPVRARVRASRRLFTVYTLREAPDRPGADHVAAAVGEAASAGYHRVVIRFERVANLRSLRGLEASDDAGREAERKMQRHALKVREPWRDASPSAQRFAAKAMADGQARGFTFVTGVEVVDCAAYDETESSVLAILGLAVPVTVVRLLGRGRVYEAIYTPDRPDEAPRPEFDAAPSAAAKVGQKRRGAAAQRQPEAHPAVFDSEDADSVDFLFGP
jgi:hypothetical protein